MIKEEKVKEFIKELKDERIKRKILNKANQWIKLDYIPYEEIDKLTKNKFGDLKK